MENSKKKPLRFLLGVLAFLVIMQLLRIIIKQLFFLVVPKTNFTDRVASMLAASILSILIVIMAKSRKMKLAVFPERIGIAGGIGIAAYLALLVSTPFVTSSQSLPKLVLLFYSAVLTPIFEELLFRTLLWQLFWEQFENEWSCYIGTTLFFSLWHLGYADSLLLRVGISGLLNALLWKLAIGLFFGIVLGALRKKSRCGLYPMLLHGAMNILGR